MKQNAKPDEISERIVDIAETVGFAEIQPGATRVPLPGIIARDGQTIDRRKLTQGMYQITRIYKVFAFFAEAPYPTDESELAAVKVAQPQREVLPMLFASLPTLALGGDGGIVLGSDLMRGDEIAIEPFAKKRFAVIEYDLPIRTIEII